jgi:hypothetical protein
MALIDSQLWIYGSDQQWNFKLPLCIRCDPQVLNAIAANYQ